VRVRCGNGLIGAIVLNKGYKEPDLEARPGGKIKAEPPLAAFLLAYLLEHDAQSLTIGDLFRQLEEETGKLTFLERLWPHLSTFLKTVLDTLADFRDPYPRFRAYIDFITITFNNFSPI
jgi:hypothetical protein